MTDPKMIGVRLPAELLEQVDQLTEKGFESRSDALRYLIQEGLDKEEIKQRLDYFQNSLNRMSFIMEWIFKSTFAATSVAQESREIENKEGRLLVKAIDPQKVIDAMELSKKVLVTELVKKFGE